jgi:hypothetical protein
MAHAAPLCSLTGRSCALLLATLVATGCSSDSSGGAAHGDGAVEAGGRADARIPIGERDSTPSSADGTSNPTDDGSNNADTIAAHDGGQGDADAAGQQDAGSGGRDTGSATVTCSITAGPSFHRYPTITSGQSKTIAWSATPAESFSSCSVTHYLPDGSLDTDDMPWATGTSGTRDATPDVLGRHEFVLNCSGNEGPCQASENLLVLEQPDTTKHLERTLDYGGADGTQWDHIIIREAGTTDISVRTVARNPNQSPPFGYELTTGISSGQTQTAILGGRTAGGDAFVTTVTYAYSDTMVTVSHSSTVGGVATGADQVHGDVSLAPDDTLPYKRSLYFAGDDDATEFVHLAFRPSNRSSVQIRTWHYNPDLDPPVSDTTQEPVATGSCRSTSTTATLVGDGRDLTTQIQYCNRSGSIEIQHRTRIGFAAFGDFESHGQIPLE